MATVAAATHVFSRGNKSFVAFRNLNDAESQTYHGRSVFSPICAICLLTRSRSSQRSPVSWNKAKGLIFELEVQNLIVDIDNVNSWHEFRKLVKCMGVGGFLVFFFVSTSLSNPPRNRSIEEISAPDFKRNHTTDMIRQKATEKEQPRVVMCRPGLA
jgi:hypothetical protein